MSTSDQYEIDPQTDDKLKNNSALENVEGLKNSANSVIIEPKFDFGDNLPRDTDGSTKLYLPEPSPLQAWPSKFQRTKACDSTRSP